MTRLGTRLYVSVARFHFLAKYNHKKIQNYCYISYSIYKTKYI